MGTNRSDNRKYYKYATIALLIVFVISLAVFFLNMWENSQSDFTGDGNFDKYIEHNGKTYELKSNIETFLILGLDKFEGTSTEDSYNNDKQADFLMLLVIDNAKKTCTSIAVNRDTMATVNILGVAGNKVGSVNKQIALAHTYGNGKEVSCRNTADALSELLGVKINHYLSMTMDSVGVYNDLLGGVEIIVLDDFTGIDDSLIKGQNVKLTGSQALTYVRARQGMDNATNLARMKRQRQFLGALKDQTIDRLEKDDSFALELVTKMGEYIVSDRSPSQLQDLLDKFSTYEFITADEIPGQYEVGEEFLEFYVDRNAVKDLVIKYFYNLIG